MKSSNNSRFDVYEAITTQIITAIEGGAGEVQLPWHRKGSAIYRPLNIASGKAYRGGGLSPKFLPATSRALGRFDAHRWA